MNKTICFDTGCTNEWGNSNILKEPKIDCWTADSTEYDNNQRLEQEDDLRDQERLELSRMVDNTLCNNFY